MYRELLQQAGEDEEELEASERLARTRPLPHTERHHGRIRARELAARLVKEARGVEAVRLPPVGGVAHHRPHVDHDERVRRDVEAAEADVAGRRLGHEDGARAMEAHRFVDEGLHIGQFEPVCVGGEGEF